MLYSHKAKAIEVYRLYYLLALQQIETIWVGFTGKDKPADCIFGDIASNKLERPVKRAGERYLPPPYRGVGANCLAVMIFCCI